MQNHQPIPVLPSRIANLDGSNRCLRQVLPLAPPFHSNVPGGLPAHPTSDSQRGVRHSLVDALLFFFWLIFILAVARLSAYVTPPLAQVVLDDLRKIPTHVLANHV